MRRIFYLMMILISLLIGCQNKNIGEIDFTTWNEELVYDFLNDVHQYVRKIPLETKSKDEIVKMYNEHFAPELSEKIFKSLYIENDAGWKVPDSDGGYIFIVPTGNMKVTN